MVPKILIAHTLQWPNAARLAMAFQAADCRVDALCRRKHPLHKLASVERIYTYQPFAPLQSLRSAVARSNPDLIVPCDDGAVTLMHRLYSCPDGSRESAGRIRVMIENSLGRPEGYPVVAARSRLASIAVPAGVLLPRTDPVRSLEDLKRWLGREGFPAVLKVDRTWGGRGVSVIRCMKEAELAFRKMTGPQNVARTLKRLICDQDPELYFQPSYGMSPVVSIQNFIRGKLANCAVACWNGEVIAGIAVEVLATQSPTGNATVVHVVCNPEIDRAARNIVGRLGMRGFCGLDFVLEETSGRPYLIEINPRATQINHLALGSGRDLVGALRARVAGEPVRGSPVMTDCDTIALFPQEWRRNPESSFLRTAYHDLPREEPALVEAYLGAPRERPRFLDIFRNNRG